MITEVCYASREDVKTAQDWQDTARNNAQLDRAMQSTARLIEGEFHRIFYPLDATMKFDWPNYQYADPWRLWFDQWDLISATSVQSPAGTQIPLGQVIFRPVNRKPGWPFTYMELDRSTAAAWGSGPTPQLSIQVTGTWGFTLDTDPAGQLAAAVTSAGATTITVSDSSQIGPGNLLIIDGERLLVQEQATVTTGQSQISGCSTASAADNVLQVTDGTQFHLGEMLLLDAERMLIVDITGNFLIVKRAWDGTVLTVHAGAVIYAYRQLTVARGQLGTTAATHSNAAAVLKHRPPSLIRDLAIAESINRVLQETSGYSRMAGAGDAMMPVSGAGLADAWDEARTVYGRKMRKRAI